MSWHTLSPSQVVSTKLAISVKANFGIAKVMPELKPATVAGG